MNDNTQMDLIVQLNIYKHHLFEYQSLRREEFIQCFQRNLNLPFINRVHIFVESDYEKEYYEKIAGTMLFKCIFNVFGRQPYYSDFIEYIREIADNTLVCITNSDIFLTESFNIGFVQYIVRDNVMLGLTRHEPTDDKHMLCNIDTCPLVHKYIGSHDTFIIRTPLLDIDTTKIKHKQNVWGAENVFQKTLEMAGYTLMNPAYQVKVFHNHRDQDWLKKNYDTIGSETTFSNPPCNINVDIQKFIQKMSVKTIVEIGCHYGGDTTKFHKANPSAEIIAFEPDPRNLRVLIEREVNKFATILPYAVSDKNGTIDFYLSSGKAEFETDQDEWSASSSIKRPTGHLSLHPWVKYNNILKVKTKRLDDIDNLKDKTIDFMHVDVQGAEDLVFIGGRETLKRTKYIFTTYCNNELYEKQLPLTKLLDILGNNWKMLYDYNYGVLLYNIN